MSDLLREKLAIVHRRSTLVDSLDGSCRLLVTILCGFAAIMLLDWLVELPWIVRAIFLGIEIAAIALVLVNRIAFPLWRTPDEEDVALRVQRHAPKLGSRLIAAIQLTRAGAVSAGTSVSMVRALVQQTEEITESIDLQRVVRLDPLKRNAIIAGCVVLIALTAMSFAGADGRDLLERALLVPGVDVPRRTHVALLTENPIVIGKGDPIELRARAIGVVPVNGSISLRYDGERDAVQLPIDAVTDHPGEFATTVQSVSQSFNYRIRLNDGQSEEGHVHASVRPAITNLEIQQTFPAYTHLPNLRRMPNDLQLLAGSQLSLKVSSSSALHPVSTDVRKSSRVIFHLSKGDATRPLALTRPAGLITPAPIDVPVDATGLAIVLVDTDGLESAEPVVYPITILPDQPPTISVTYPLTKEQLSTPLARLVVGVEAQDDFALGRVSLCYRIVPPDESSGDAAAVKPTATINFRLPGTPAQFRGRYPFDLANLHPRPVEGGSVEWWLEAEDTNNVTGPGRAASDHYLTRIASEAEVRADLYSQLSEHMAALKQTADAQKKDNADLGDLIQQRVVP